MTTSYHGEAIVLYLGSEFGGGGKYVEQLLHALNELQVTGTLITFYPQLTRTSGKLAVNVFADDLSGWWHILLSIAKLTYRRRCRIIAADHRSLRLLPFVKGLAKNSTTTFFLQTSLRTSNTAGKRLFRKLLFNFVDTICGVSKSVLKDVAELGYKGNTAVVYPALPTGDSETPNRDARNEDNIVLLPARLVEGKGHIDLIRAADGRNWNIWFAGDGPYHQKLVSFCVNKNNITFLGWVDEMRETYLRASVVVLPSYSEGLGIVLLEAMKYGCTVVAYDLDSIKEVVENGVTGLIVKTGNYEELGIAVQNVLDDRVYANKLRTNAATFVRTNHSLQRMVSSLIDALAWTR